jgi:hypothetical protein
MIKIPTDIMRLTLGDLEQISGVMLLTTETAKPHIKAIMERENISWSSMKVACSFAQTLFND